MNFRINNFIEEKTKTVATANIGDFTEDKRKYGIDLLRIIAMVLVVVLHILGQGGILIEAEKNEIKFAVVWLLEIVAYCAVNCYALISGFVYFSEENKQVKLSKYIKLWLQVEFYSVLITLYFWQFYPNLVNKKQLVKSFFPILSEQYWYFSAYTGVYFIIPWLNKIIQGLKEKELKTLVFCVLIFSSYIIGANLFKVDLFGLKGGYSFLWLAILYVIGGYIKKHKLYHKIKKEMQY